MGSATRVCSNLLTCGSVSIVERCFLFLLQENLQIYLKSTQGPIEVYLCPEEGQEPDSPAKEALPSSTSSLSPAPDCVQPGCSSDSGIAETVESSGRPSAGGEVGVPLILRGGGVCICRLPNILPAGEPSALLCDPELHAL